MSISLREKCPNTDAGIQENTDQKKLRIWTLFMQCISLYHCSQLKKNVLKAYTEFLVLNLCTIIFGESI